jgi:hypothetical protein
LKGAKLTEGEKIVVELNKFELKVLLNAVGNASPILEDEIILFKLYHKLLFKLNECK